MSEQTLLKAAIVDFGMGNLFSVRQACTHAGMSGTITSSPKEIVTADAVILPGVGAFGDAMDALKKLDLVQPLLDVAASGKPLIGVCLGMQLLMSESYEFGHHKGLDLIAGSVVRFEDPRSASGHLKVPQVGWNRVYASRQGSGRDRWSYSPFKGLEDGDFMYFVHSFYVKPNDPQVTLSFSRYGQIEFCSSLLHRNIFACQFHPERSGSRGLQIYKNLSPFVRKAFQHKGEGIL